MRWTRVIVGTLALALGTVSLARAQGLVIARNPSQVLVLASPATDPSLATPISDLSEVHPTAAACVDTDMCLVATDRAPGGFYELHVVRLSTASLVRSVDACGKIQFGVPAIAVNAARTVAIATDLSIARRQVVVFP